MAFVRRGSVYRERAVAVFVSGGFFVPQVHAGGPTRFSLCVSLREESNSRSPFRFNALMTPMRAGTIELSDQEQGFDGALPLLEILVGLRKLHDVSGGTSDEMEEIGSGTHQRMVIDLRPFNERLAKKSKR
jgi:hypothetical protein